MIDESQTLIAQELDELHAEARSAYARKDLSAYRQFFSPDLQYTQLNGKTIGLDQLMSDVNDQFSRVSHAESRYERVSFELIGSDTVVEELIQFASLEMSVFFVFKRRWALERRGRYTLIRTADGWRISKVKVLAESVV